MVVMFARENDASGVSKEFFVDIVVNVGEDLLGIRSAVENETWSSLSGREDSSDPMRIFSVETNLEAIF